MKPRTVATVAFGAALIVGAVAFLLLSDVLSDGPSNSKPTVFIIPPKAVDRTSTVAPNAVSTPRSLLTQQTQLAADPAAASPGRLLAAPGSVEPPPGVSLSLIACEPADPEDADVSLGDDRSQWRDVGDRLAPAAWTEGAWDWPSLAPGTWRLVASDDSTHVPTGRAAGPLQVRADRTTHVDVDLLPAGALSVRLVRADGDGVAGAAVRVLGPLPAGCGVETDWGDLVGTRVWRTTTDSEGVFTLTGLEDGQAYGVHAWRNGGDMVTDVLVAARPPVEMRTLVATEARHVLVRVTARADGRALPGAFVQVNDEHLIRLRGVAREASPNRPLRSAGPTDGEGLVAVDVEPGAWLLAGCDGFDLGGVRVPPHTESGAEIRVALGEPGDGLVHVVTASGTPIFGATVESTVTGTANGRNLDKKGGSARSDARGAVRLEDFDHWDDLDSGTLRLAAHHDVQGIGGLALDIGTLVQEQRGLARTLVLRSPGNLQVDVSSTGWPEPTLEPFSARFGPADVRERQVGEQLLALKLWYLGTPGLRTEFSSQHGERRNIDLNGFAGGTPSARFDGLEPGDYCVELWSPARGVSIISPALRITSGETTHHWMVAPDTTTHARLTVVPDVASAHRGGEQPVPVVVLLPEDGFAFHGALPLLLSPAVAGRDRRAELDPSGRATFEWVPPGRWVVGIMTRNAQGTPVWRQSTPFMLGPGEDLVLDVVLKPAAAPNGLMF